MKKLAILIVAILSMACSQLSAQNVAVKTNFLYWATTTPNIGAEVSIDRNHTVQMFFGLNPWKQSGGDHSTLRHWSFTPEYRYWLCEATYGNPVNAKLTRQQAYTPMKFSKVVIPENKLVYPGLGNIVYRVGNDIATKLTNFKGEEATSGIAYDFVVSWNDNTADPADHSTDGNGTFKCETFHGNLCDQIFFKAQAELLNQPYLIYNKAFVEKEVESKKWNLVSTPMKNIYAGDFFVPQTTGREESKTAFSAMKFDGTSDNRVAAPVYQRNWDSNATQVVDRVTNYKAHDYNGTNISIDTISDASMNVESLYWSHVYNKLDEKYEKGKGFALKAGDQYKQLSAKWLFRLPKEDVEYKYFKPDGGYSDQTVTLSRSDLYRLNVLTSNEPGLLGEISLPLTGNTHSINRYYIVGNPYTASLSMYRS